MRYSPGANWGGWCAEHVRWTTPAFCAVNALNRQITKTIQFMLAYLQVIVDVVIAAMARHGKYQSNAQYTP
jgi:hypothetical protein